MHFHGHNLYSRSAIVVVTVARLSGIQFVGY